MLAVELSVGPLQDALFGGVLVANTLIGISQELRAKRALDRLVVLSAPSARVVRSGRTMDIPVLAVAVTRLSRHRALIQELPAVETLARVTTLCFDKTGTLTTGEAVVDSVEIRDDGADVAGALNALASADPMPNATLRAIAARYPAAAP